MLLPKLGTAVEDENVEAEADGCWPKSGGLDRNGVPGPVDGFNLMPAKGDGIGVPLVAELMDESLAMVRLLALITDRRSITSLDAMNDE